MGKLILVVDDDSDDRDLFREALNETDKSVGYICVRNGIEAIGLLSRPNIVLPDFIFLDLNMPRMDGRECLTRLRHMPWLNEIAIIIFSTSKLDDECASFKKLGANLCITKPLLFEDLKKVITFVISEEWRRKVDRLKS